MIRKGLYTYAIKVLHDEIFFGFRLLLLVTSDVPRTDRRYIARPDYAIHAIMSVSGGAAAPGRPGAVAHRPALAGSVAHRPRKSCAHPAASRHARTRNHNVISDAPLQPRPLP